MGSSLSSWSPNSSRGTSPVRRVQYLDSVYTDGRDLTDQQLADLDNYTRATYEMTRAHVRETVPTEVIQKMQDLYVSHLSPSTSPRPGRGRLLTRTHFGGRGSSRGAGPPTQHISPKTVDHISGQIGGLNLSSTSDFPTPQDSLGWSPAKRPLRVPRLGLQANGVLYLGTGAQLETELNSDGLDSRNRFNQLVPSHPRSAKHKPCAENKFSSLS